LSFFQGWLWPERRLMETMIMLCMLYFFVSLALVFNLFEHVANAKNGIALLNGQLVMLKKEWTKELVDGNMN